MQARCQGWGFGVAVRYASARGCDVADVWLTGGSNGKGPDQHLGTFTADDLAPPAEHGPCAAAAG